MTQCQREAGPDYGAASHRYVQVVAVVEVELVVVLVLLWEPATN